MAKLTNLDGVRATAVLLVVACHLLLTVRNGANLGFYDIGALGHLGVAIFFVHTSFVLMGSLERHGSAPIPFYVRRIFRIYPLSVAIVLFIGLIQLTASEQFDTHRFLSNLLLTQNFTHDLVYTWPMWSLPYELQMYLFLPAFFFVITRTKNPVFWCFSIFFASLLLAASDPGNLARFAVKYVDAPFIRYVPCFSAGALAFALSLRAPKVLHPVWLGTFLVVGIALIPMLVSRGTPSTPLMWSFCLVIAIIIPLSQELSCKPVMRASKTVATYSYGVYLTHLLAFTAIEGMMPGPPVVQWAGMLILLVGLPYICYHGIEKHGVALGARLAERWVRRKQPACRGGAAGGEAG